MNVYVTNEQNGHRLYDDEGFIGEFKDTYNNIMAASDGIRRRMPNIPNIWVLTLDDPKLIERIEKYPGYGTRFKKQDKEPVYSTMQGLKKIIDPNQANVEIMNNGIAKQVDEQVKAERIRITNLSREYGILFSQICKAGGEFLKDADPLKIQRFQQLKEELGINEEIGNGVEH